MLVLLCPKPEIRPRLINSYRYSSRYDKCMALTRERTRQRLLYKLSTSLTFSHELATLSPIMPPIMTLQSSCRSLYFPHMTPKQRVCRHLRCLGHVINLAAKDFLYGKEFDTSEKDINTVKEHSELLKELQL